MGRISIKSIKKGPNLNRSPGQSQRDRNVRSLKLGVGPFADEIGEINRCYCGADGTVLVRIVVHLARTIAPVIAAPHHCIDHAGKHGLRLILHDRAA